MHAGSSSVIPLGPYEVVLDGQGLNCVIPPVEIGENLLEFVALYCSYDKDRYHFSAEVHVDPRNDEVTERIQEFVFRNGSRAPYRAVVACN